MTERLEDVYFEWLCAKVLDRNSRLYTRLLTILHNTEFVAIVPADRHRVADGVELRQDFMRESYLPRDPLWEELPCSVLELLIAFAQRAEFLTNLSEKKWFWEMMANLGLDQFRHVSDSDVPIIEDILDTFVSRRYDRFGRGGLFPMNSVQRDQRRVEIYYQFCEYLEYQQLV